MVFQPIYCKKEQSLSYVAIPYISCHDHEDVLSHLYFLHLAFISRLECSALRRLKNKLVRTNILYIHFISNSFRQFKP
jgi:hypothetical protein